MNNQDLTIIWDGGNITPTLMTVDLECPDGSPVILVNGYWDVSLNPPLKVSPYIRNAVLGIGVLDCSTGDLKYLSSDKFSEVVNLLDYNCDECDKAKGLDMKKCDCIIDTEVTLTGKSQTITAASQGMKKILNVELLETSGKTFIAPHTYNAARDEVIIEENPTLAGEIARVLGYEV